MRDLVVALRGPQTHYVPRRKAAFNHEAVDEDMEASGVGAVRLGNPLDANRVSSSVAEAKPVPVEGTNRLLLQK